MDEMKSAQGRHAANRRWANTHCKGLRARPRCHVKGVHLRGYADCMYNPDPDTYGYNRRDGGSGRRQAITTFPTPNLLKRQRD